MICLCIYMCIASSFLIYFDYCYWIQFSLLIFYQWRRSLSCQLIVIIIIIYMYMLHIFVVLLRSIRFHLMFGSMHFTIIYTYHALLLLPACMLASLSTSQQQSTHNIIIPSVQHSALPNFPVLLSYILASTYYYYYLNVDNKTKQRNQTLGRALSFAPIYCL